MFIQTDMTPNPNTIKFLPGLEILPSGRSYEFNSEKSAEYISPLAMLLFSIKGVKGVFFGEDFIAVTKTDNIDWEELRASILGRLMDHFIAKMPVFFDEVNVFEEESVEESFDEADKDIVNEIKELLEIRVRPAVSQDGGDIIFHGFKNGVVYLRMKGACAGCPSSTMTLKHGIENMLRHYVPEVVSVEAVNIA